jgi:hypothetical protein
MICTGEAFKNAVKMTFAKGALFFREGYHHPAHIRLDSPVA